MVNFLCSLKDNELNLNSNSEDFDKLIKLIDMAPIYQQLNVLFPPKSRLCMSGINTSNIYRNGVVFPLDIDPHIGTWKNQIKGVRIRQSNSCSDHEYLRIASINIAKNFHGKCELISDFSMEDDFHIMMLQETEVNIERFRASEIPGYKINLCCRHRKTFPFCINLR